MGGILHLSANGHLQQQSMAVFERYYPNQNIMLAIPPKDADDVKIDLPEERFRWMDYGNVSTYGEIEELCHKNNIDKIVLHSVFIKNLKLAEYLKSKLNCRIYWLFWGFELYSALGEDFGVSYIDEKFNPFKVRTYFYPNRIKHCLRYLRYGTTFSQVLQKATSIADYFCFWNKYDYELYTKYFGDRVKFKLFGYVCRYRNEAVDENFDFPEKKHEIIINHQASATGNHITLMKRVKQLDTNGQFDITMPLSYGSGNIRKLCMKQGTAMFGPKFHPILKFMPKDEYFNLIDRAQVALFGQKRQEATGNIGHLLTVGTKVFLREENPMYAYYKSKGYYVYSFEKDLKSIDDLSPLSREEMIHNRKVWYKTRLYYDDFMPYLFNE